MAGDDHQLADKDHDQADKAPAPPAPAPAPKKPKLNEVERRASRVMWELNMRLEDAQRKIDSGQATSMDEAELESMKASINANRSQVIRAAQALLPNDPLLEQATQLTDQAAEMTSRLDTFSRAAQGHTKNAGKAAKGDKAELYERAEQRGPVGYCDGEGKQDHVQCDLGEAKRNEYRRQITLIVGLTNTAWTAAINAKRVEELIKKDEVRFEQQLGQMLLGLMFKGLGELGKTAVNKVVKKAAKVLTTETDLGVYPGTTEKDTGLVDVVKTGGEKGITKGVDALEKVATGHKTSQQLRDDAVVTSPADRTEFLQVMNSAPTTWSFSILSNLTQLYDEDLAALFDGLPATPPSQADFEQWIDDLLKRFSEQVLAVNHEVRPIQVMGPNNRMRRALITADTKMDSSLHGDARHSPVRTGRMRFIRWIDDDMADMAQAHSIEQNPMNSMQEVRRFDDSEFWGNESLMPLANGMRSAPTAPSNPLAPDLTGRS